MDAQPPSQVRLWYSQFAVPTAVLTGIICVVLAGIAAYDYLDSHRYVHEHATVVAVVDTGEVCVSGHAVHGPDYTVTWHSADPPPGRLATFTQSHVCTRYAVGDTRIVVRRSDDLSGRAEIEVSPFDSMLDEVVFVVLGTLVGVPVAFFLALARKFWRLWRSTASPTTR